MSIRPSTSSLCTGWTRRIGRCCGAICGEALPRGVRQAAADKGGTRSLRGVLSLGPRTAGARPRGGFDPAAIRQAIRQAQQERPQRCRGDQRSGGAAGHGAGAGEIRRAAGRRDVAVGSRTAEPPTHAVGQRLARPRRRVRPGRRQRGQGPGRADRGRAGELAETSHRSARAAQPSDRPSRGGTGAGRREAAGTAPGAPSKPPARDDPGCGLDDRVDADIEGRRLSIRIRATPRSMDRARAAGELNRRQTEARWHQSGGRRAPPQPAGARRHGGDPTCQAGHEFAMATVLAGAQAPQARGGGPGQQDSPHCVGYDDERGEVSAAQRCLTRSSCRWFKG